MRILVSSFVALVSATLLAQVATPPPPPVQKPTLAQIGLFIYPAQGQPPEQQAKDESACFQWAETQTGLTLQAGSVDTQAAAKAGAKAGSEKAAGAVVGGAAVGAVTGTAIGAIAGSAGKGAAIGAVAGAMGGIGARQKAKSQGAKAGVEQATRANQENVERFKKAAGACLEGRGYTVK
jgi:hypothetical protein